MRRIPDAAPQRLLTKPEAWRPTNAITMLGGLSMKSCLIIVSLLTLSLVAQEPAPTTKTKDLAKKSDAWKLQAKELISRAFAKAGDLNDLDRAFLLARMAEVSAKLDA